MGGSLTTRFWVVHELTQIAFDRSFRRVPTERSSPKGCSRLARPPRMSQATAEMKREQSICFGEGNWGKRDKNIIVLVKFCRCDWDSLNRP
jgi:hypothetical protein